MKQSTRQHIKSSAALAGTGVVVMPILGFLIEAAAEIIGLPQFSAQVEAWFGVGTLMTLAVLIVCYRGVAALLNWWADKSNQNKGVAGVSRHSEEYSDAAVKI